MRLLFSDGPAKFCTFVVPCPDFCAALFHCLMETASAAISLHKESGSGHRNVWRVSFGTNSSNGNATAIYTWGTEGGKLQSRTIEYAQGKQSRDKHQQAEFEARSKEIKKLREGYVSSSIRSLPPSDKASTAAAPPRPMLAFEFKKRPKKAPSMGETVSVQHKFDGMRCMADPNTGTLWSRTGRQIFGLAHIEAEVRGLRSACEKHGVRYLDGEIYLHGLSFQKIVSRLRFRSKSSSLDAKAAAELQYHCFDCIATDTEAPFDWRQSSLADIVSPAARRSSIVLADTWDVDVTDLDECLASSVAEGYEGIIVRTNASSAPYEVGKRSAFLLKLKQFMDEEFECCDFQAERGSVEAGAPTLGALVLRLGDGTKRTFQARPAMTRERRQEIWDARSSFVGRTVTVKFQEKTDEGVPRFPTAVGFRADE